MLLPLLLLEADSVLRMMDSELKDSLEFWLEPV